MKIYILPVHPSLQPRSTFIVYPAHNVDYGVEQDMLKYLISNRGVITDDPNLADWHYLPVYWTRWHLNHDYAHTGLMELSNLVVDSIIDPKKTFTVCQYDDGPVINIKNIKLMLSSRKGRIGIDVPLLANPLRIPLFRPKKRLLSTFIGRISNHKIRSLMYEELRDITNIEISDERLDTKKYIYKMLESYTALCPRGYGGSSFRFYESMELKVVPILIGDIDTRPFKKYIDWESCSFFVRNPADLVKVLNNKPNEELVQMGNNARLVWDKYLKYSKWCNLALKELEYQHAH